MNLDDAVFKALQANLVHAGRFFKQFTIKTYQYRFTAEAKYSKEANDLLRRVMEHTKIIEQLSRSFDSIWEPTGLTLKLMVDYPEEAFWYEQAAAYINSLQELTQQPLSNN